MFEATAVGQVLDVHFGDRITSYLPSAHIADRFTALYLQLCSARRSRWSPT